MRIFLQKFLVLAMLFTLFGNSVFAIDYYWKSTGRADQNYTNAANWESAPGSGIPANGALAPSSADDVFFPIGNGVQTITVAADAAARNFNVLSTGVITFSGTPNVYGSFISNGKHLFAGGMTFLGTGNHTINMGDNLPHSSGTSAHDFIFSGTGTYTLLSDLNLPYKAITIVNSTFVANGFWIQAGSFAIGNTGSGTKTVNLANSKLSVNKGAANSGALLFVANPATTLYNFTNTEIYINQTTNSTFINTGSATTNGTVINGIKSITFTESTPGVSAEHIRSNQGSFTIGVTDLNLNVSAFNFTGSGINLNMSNLNLLKPVDITANGTSKLSVNAIHEAASCVGQSSLRSEGATRIAFNATAPISTSNIGFKSIAFSGSNLSMPVNNDLGLNTGTYSTTTTVPSRSFYWVGGTGNWNDPTKWSLIGSGGLAQTSSGCLPTYNDDVYFDASSFTASGQTVTIGGSGSSSAMGYVRNIYWADPNNRGKLAGGILNVNGSADFSGSIGVASSLVYVGSGNHTVKSGTNFVYTSSTIQFFGTGTYTLTDDLIGGASTNLSLGAGTFNSNGKAITMSRFASSSIPALASNLRNINFSNSVLTFTGGYTGGLTTFALSTPFLNSFNAAGSTINLPSITDVRFTVSGYVNDGTVTLSTLTFNDINFTGITGTPVFANTGVVNFAVNNLNFSANATITQTASAGFTHRVNNYNLSPGKTYTFSATASSTALIYTVVNSINTNSVGSCSPKVTIRSGTAGTRAKIYKASLPFDVQNAVLQDINATGVTMTVPGGEDLGNNVNVNITSNPSQNFYWVGGTGNWNDASHWSIGTSGGNPALNNANNCIPGLNDDVFFDANSFTANNQVVTIDVDASCRNMVWSNAVSSRTPVFAGVAGLNLNTYGSVTLAPNMTFSFAGNWNMRGTSTAVNANAITTNGIRVYSSRLILIGGGRYDLLDDLNMKAVSVPSGGGGFYFTLGRFYTNGHNINADGMSLTVTGTNIADISNSTITLTSIATSVNTYTASHSSNANWNAAGSTINAFYRHFVVNPSTGVTVDYGTLNMKPGISGANINNSGNGMLRFTNLTWLSAGSGNTFMLGNMEIGNLTYFTSSNNSLGAGDTYRITGSLNAAGTPCNPVRFSSSSTGTPAILTAANCDFDIKFARLTNITAGGTCTAAQNKVIGDDAGGNSNWTFSTIASAEYLGADKVLTCNQYPYTLSTVGFNQDATSILWSNGATTPDITVTGPGTYSVTVTYGAGCTLTDAITLGLTPSPVLAATTIYACETTQGAAIGDFNLTDANAVLVTTPANYTFTYHTSSADAIAGLNQLASPYNSNSKTIYVRVVETATGCFSTRDVVLTVRPKVSPVAATNQKFCATVHTSLAQVAISGTNIKWYTDATSTTVLPLSTLLVNGHTYYATQTVNNGCESVRLPITVTLENCSMVNPSIRSRTTKLN